MKKLVALLIVAIMVVGTVMTVSAAEAQAASGYTITITDVRKDHTYEAYQIFAGELSDGEDKLSDITWGTGVDAAKAEAEFGEAASKADDLKTTADAQEFAKAVKDCLVAATSEAVKKSTESTVGDKVIYTIAGLEPGYYLIKDMDESLAGKDDSYTSYMLKLVKNQSITTKSDMSEVEKKVKDIDDSDADGYTDWQDSADYDIGDSVPFQLKATLAHNVESYATYKVVFHDTISNGLTYEDNAKVTLDGKDVTGSFTITSTENSDGTTSLKFACDNVKALGATGDSVIIVEYTAELNENAVLGAKGNPNKVYLEYSNNPNQETENTETGKTPEDQVIVFTYKVVINKVDKDGNPLAGATFKLEKVVKETVGGASTHELVGEYKIPEDGTSDVVKFEFTGLDDGEYILTETNTPDGYNTMKPVTFLVTAHHSTLADEPVLESLSGNAITGEIDFSALVASDGKLTGELSTNVVNYQGSQLPETGGIGTTIFYVIGTILVAGTGVVLITRRRMNNK